MSDWIQLDDDNWKRVLDEDGPVYKVIEVKWQEERGKWRWNYFEDNKWIDSRSGYNTANSAKTDVEDWLWIQGLGS